MALSSFEKYPTINIKRRLPLDYNGLQLELKELVKETSHVPSLAIHTISNAFVSPYGVIFKNGFLVKASVYGMLLNTTNNFTFFKKLFLGKIRKIDKKCLVALNGFSDNYYHWTTECLPRLFACREYRKDIVVLLPKRSPRFVVEYVKLLEFENIEFIAEDEMIKATEVVFPNHFEFAIFHPQLLQDTRDYLLSKIKWIPSTPEKIFLSRKLAKYRNSKQEVTLLSQCAELGFIEIVPETLSIPEQIALFANVTHLVGIHGAGFSNMLFMIQGKVCIDIIHWSHYDQAFYNLSQINNIEYKYFSSEEKPITESFRVDDVTIDVERFMKENARLLI